MTTTEKLAKIESTIESFAQDMEAGSIRIAAYLALVEDHKLWQDKYDDDGKPPRHFQHYLSQLALELRDKQIKASKGNFERWLSFYRLFHETLDMSFEQIMYLGPTILDEVRKIIDWDHKTRTIGEGGNGKLPAEEAREYIQQLLGEMDSAGKIFTPAIREDVEKRLGRTPLRATLTVRKLPDGTCRLTQVSVWEGPTIHRTNECVEERIVHWLSMRLRAKISWVE